MPIRLAALLAVVAACSASALEPPRVVVLVTLDTTRADHLGCYGYPRPTTPFIDSLARDGVLFESAFSAISLTAPSHATLFTGLHPDQHLLWKNGDAFVAAGTPQAGRFATLAERFAERGYATAAFTGVRWLQGISRGFDSVNLGERSPGLAYRTADATVVQVVDWLKLRRREERVFVWVHLFDPHLPRRAPEEHARALRFRSAAEAVGFAGRMTAERGLPSHAFRSPGELAAAYAAYDAEIRFADRELQRLHSFMKREGWLRDAWWVVTADHGEGLGQHGHMEHARFVYDEQIRVPLVFAGAKLPRGRRVRGLAQLADLWPTFVSLLGETPAQPGYALAGISLAPTLLEAAALPPRQACATRRPGLAGGAPWEPGDLFALHDLDWKYIAKSQGEDELYDLRRDPRERHNLIATPSTLRERLEEATRAAWARLRSEGARFPPPPRPRDAENEEGLRALGYVN